MTASNDIGDIQDGRVYQAFIQNMLRAGDSRTVFSVVLSCDGAPLIKCRTTSRSKVPVFNSSNWIVVWNMVRTTSDKQNYRTF